MMSRTIWTRIWKSKDFETNLALVTHVVEKQFTPEEELLSASSGMRRYEPRLIAESLKE